MLLLDRIILAERPLFVAWFSALKWAVALSWIFFFWAYITFAEYWWKIVTHSTMWRTTFFVINIAHVVFTLIHVSIIHVATYHPSVSLEVGYTMSSVSFAIHSVWWLLLAGMTVVVAVSVQRRLTEAEFSCRQKVTLQSGFVVCTMCLCVRASNDLYTSFSHRNALCLPGMPVSQTVTMILFWQVLPVVCPSMFMALVMWKGTSMQEQASEVRISAGRNIQDSMRR